MQTFTGDFTHKVAFQLRTLPVKDKLIISPRSGENFYRYFVTLKSWPAAGGNFCGIGPVNSLEMHVFDVKSLRKTTKSVKNSPPA